MKPPKLDHMTAVQIQSMGRTLGLCYQPEHMFIKNGRKLSRVAEPGDPWFVTLRRMDRVILAEGSTVSTATGSTFAEAIEVAIPRGVKASLLRAERAIDRLVATIPAG